MPSSSSFRNYVRDLVPAKIRTWVHTYRSDYQTSKSADRVLLVKEIIPALTQTLSGEPDVNILWVGCRRYTKEYYKLIEKYGAHCWTIDNDPSVEQWGRKGRHVTGSILYLKQLFPAQQFDAVLCNGILGWGVDTPAAQQTALTAMSKVTKPGGWMLLGWDTNKITDPLDKAAPWFEHAELPGIPARQTIKGYYTHVYDIFRQRTNVDTTIPNF